MIHLRFPTKLIMLLVLILTCGCQPKSVGPDQTLESERIPPDEKLIASPDSRLPDVPVPLGAYFKAGSSSSYQTGDQRTVNYVYGIWAKPVLARTFYRDNMPLHAWEYLHGVSNPNAEAFSYRKAGESCVITVGPKNWLLQTTIRIEIQPVDVSY